MYKIDWQYCYCYCLSVTTKKVLKIRKQKEGNLRQYLLHLTFDLGVTRGADVGQYDGHLLSHLGVAGLHERVYALQGRSLLVEAEPEPG